MNRVSDILDTLLYIDNIEDYYKIEATNIRNKHGINLLFNSFRLTDSDLNKIKTNALYIKAVDNFKCNSIDFYINNVGIHYRSIEQQNLSQSA